MIPLLSDAALRRLVEEALGPQGLDAGMSEEEAGAFNAIPTTVLCMEGRDVLVGTDCATHGCPLPECDRCPGRD